MNEDDVRAALKHPLVSIDTDSGAMAEDGPLSDTRSHPRAWGTFPRILGKYVRDERLLTLEEAVRKMTSHPAARVGLSDRGILRPGMMADVVVFDPATIRDIATFEDPQPLLGRHEVRAGERRGGDCRRHDHGGETRARAARPRLASPRCAPLSRTSVSLVRSVSLVPALRG